MSTLFLKVFQPIKTHPCVHLGFMSNITTIYVLFAIFIYNIYNLRAKTLIFALYIVIKTFGTILSRNEIILEISSKFIKISNILIPSQV